MSTLGVITDTHIPQRIKTLPPRVFEVFRGVDRILHAGDINAPDFYNTPGPQVGLLHVGAQTLQIDIVMV